jgi:hypothetical protein
MVHRREYQKESSGNVPSYATYVLSSPNRLRSIRIFKSNCCSFPFTLGSQRRTSQRIRGISKSIALGSEDIDVEQIMLSIAVVGNALLTVQFLAHLIHPLNAYTEDVFEKPDG